MEQFERFSLGLYKFLDERLGISTVLKATVMHQVPRSVNWWYVFGSMVLTAFLLQVVTGIFLAFTYVPTPSTAYSSLQYITNDQYFGHLLRGLHYWGASAMVMLIFVHMSAHFLTGSYKYPRELHWLTGGVLLILTIVMAFTGQLIRWNQDSYWAIVVGAEQAARTPFIGSFLAQLLLAGPHVGGETLTRMYAIHIWLVPGALFTFIGIHLYLVIYKGISEWPVPGKPVDPKTYWAEYQEILHNDGEPFFPKAISKDAMAVTAMIILIFCLAVFIGPAALGVKANPTVPANPKPDWYLIWYFAILAAVGVSGGGAAVTPYLIILFPAVAFAIVFLIPLANKGERHYARRPWAIATVFLAGMATAVLLFVGYAEPWKPILVNNFTAPPALPKATYANLPTQEQAGAKLLHTYACLACHYVHGVGGHRGPTLDGVGARLTTGELIWRIAHGGGGMPAFGNDITPKQMDDLIAYLSSLGGSPQQAAAGTQP